MLAFIRSIIAQGGAQIAGVLLALIATKIVAVVLGAAGTGFLALLRQLHDLAIGWVGLGVGQGLVQGLSARQGDERRHVLAVGWRLYALAAGFCIAVFLAFPGIIAGLVMDRHDADAIVAVRLVGLTAGLGLAANLLSAMLQAHGAIVQYAVVQILGNLALAAAAYPVARAAMDQPAALTALIAVPLVAQIVATLALNRGLALGRQLRAAMSGWDAQAFRHFTGYVGFGLAQLAIGIGSGLMARALIVHAYSLDSVGHFQAAWALSAQSVALLLTPFMTYAIPKLAGMQIGSDAYRKTWNDMALVVWAATVPLVVVGLAVKALLLPIFYSGEFLDAVPLLQWMLAANMVKSASWILMAPFLAAGRLKPHVAMAVVLDGSFVVGVWAATHWGFELHVIGMAFFVSYSLYLAGSWVLCGRYFALRFSARLLGSMTLGAALAGAVAAWTWDGRAVDWPAAIFATMASAVVALGVLDRDRRGKLLSAVSLRRRRQ